MTRQIVKPMHIFLIPAVFAITASNALTQSVLPVAQNVSSYPASRAQQTIALNLQNVTVREAVTEIARAADIRLSADDDLLSGFTKRVTIVKKTILAGEALK